METRDIRAIVFDFGNTLCPWSEEQYWEITRATLTRICSKASGHDFDSAYKVFSRFRNEESQRTLPNLRENDLPRILKDTAHQLAGRAFTASENEDVIQTHINAFAGVCKTPDGLAPMLDRLSRRYRLAVLSNYSIGDCIRAALSGMGIAGYFDPILVSADVGIIKPSPQLFGMVIENLGLPSQNILFAGDDWIADVVGACASGMPCVHIDGGGSVQLKTLDNIFGTYLRQALELPELSCWQEAKPEVVLDSVLGLEKWLEEHNK